MRLAGKVALVSGGARGIGEAIARRFVAEGASVMIADVLEDEGRAVAENLGDAARFMRLDVTSSENWDAVIAATEAAFGKLDTLVNNAGVIVFKTLDDHSEAEMRRILDINLLGVMLGTQRAVPAIERAGKGAVVNISSADGLDGANALTAYCASKWGVRGFTKAAALELGPRGIRVNSIHPGGIATPLANPTNIPRETFDTFFRIYPAQRAGDPSEIASAAVFLASDESAYCMGSELAVDGGLTAGHYYMGMPGSPQL